MKIENIIYPLSLLLIILYFCPGCRKSKEQFLVSEKLDYLEEKENFPSATNIDSLLELESCAPIPFPTSGRYNCLKKLLYKDSVLYNKSKDGKEYIVKVDNNPGAGKYYSWPQGLILDSLTGSVNVSASQGGYRYAIGFVKAGTRDTCLQDIILSGASYEDSIYVFNEMDTLAYPYFNADLNSGSICDVSGDEDYPGNGANGNGNNKCEFDVEDAKGIKGKANKKHVKVRTISGVINLKKTLDEGAFGSANPSNGQGLVVPVYYKLNDKGGKALQKLSVQLIYYKTKADIPSRLIDYMRRRRSQAASMMLISASGNPRPPLIVITRS